MSKVSLRILFVGASWKGSSARSLKEGLSLLPNIFLDEIGEDHYKPSGRSYLVRGVNRILTPWYQAELKEEILKKVAVLKPDVLIVYKGGLVSCSTVRSIKGSGVFTVNVFPDYSPHAYGKQLQKAMGEYDLVVSTKPFHPANWRSLYGYTNLCAFVPHGYDPEVHYWDLPPEKQDMDLIMVSGWRPQYEELLIALSTELDTSNMSVLIAGPGWTERRQLLPSHWVFEGGLQGRAYGEKLRRGKIIIAPVHRKVIINRQKQPGDEDTTRTYELAAAGCFFVHRRTPYVQSIYSESEEVPMWDDAHELAGLIRKYLPLVVERRRMSLAAHRRAVPVYSIPARAEEVMGNIADAMNRGSNNAG